MIGKSSLMLNEKTKIEFHLLTKNNPVDNDRISLFSRGIFTLLTFNLMSAKITLKSMK